MKGQELIDMINNGTLPVVRFTSKIEDWEGYFDANMIARAVSCQVEKRFNEDEDTIFKVTFHCEKWDEHNSLVEKCNYWDNERNATWSARQAGCHPEKSNWREDYWFGLEEDLPLEIVEKHES